MAAGGTGGHIYPAIALGQALRDRDPAIQIHYCCGNRPGELEIYRAAGIDPVVLPLSGNRPGIANRLRFASEVWAAYRTASAEVRSFRPQVAVGFGSYVSVPALVAARRSGAVTVIHEQNATPGLANRWLSRRAALILTGIPVAPGVFPEAKTRLTGNPIRKELLAPIDAKLAKRALGLSEAEPVCLCFGGSLGAARVNRMLLAAIQEVAPATRWQFLWAAGPANFEVIRKEIQAKPEIAARVTLMAYLERMDYAYAAADLVVCRAGAITLAELTALGKPSILIPLPTAAAGHQRSNAEVLAAAGAALVIDENEPGGVEKMSTALMKLGQSCDMLLGMSQAARRLGSPDAARKMVEAIAQLGITRKLKTD